MTTAAAALHLDEHSFCKLIYSHKSALLMAILRGFPGFGNNFDFWNIFIYIFFNLFL